MELQAFGPPTEMEAYLDRRKMSAPFTMRTIHELARPIDMIVELDTGQPSVPELPVADVLDPGMG